MIASFPLALANQAAHSRGFAALVRASEYLFVGPMTGFGAIGAYLAVNGVHYGIFADHAGNHARPAAMRIHVPNILEGDGFMPVGLGHTRVVFPPLAILVVPTRILEFEPLEVFFRHGVDAPEIGEPACGEELGSLMHISLVS